MTISDFEATGCLGKEAFTSPQMARRGIRKQPGREAYKCQTCGFWHVGTAKPKKNRDWRTGRRGKQRGVPQ